MATLESAPPRAPRHDAAETTAALRRRHRAFHRETDRLERLCADAAGASDHDLALIVAAARGDVRRAIDLAFQQLAALAALRPAPPPRIDVAAEPESIVRIRRDIEALLEQTQADYERSAAEAVAAAVPLDGAAALAATSSARAIPRAFDPANVLFRDDALPLRRSRKAMLQVAAAIGGVLVAGAAALWTASAFRSRTDAPHAAPSARTATAAPAGNPSPPSAAPPAAADAGRSVRTAPAVPVDHTGPLTLWLRVEARRATHIRTTIDGGAGDDRILEPGESRRLMAADSVTLSAADAGALNVSFNGGAVTAFGPDGQTATRRYTIADAPKISERRMPVPERPSPAVASAPATPVAAPMIAAPVPAPVPSAATASVRPPNRADTGRVELDADSRMQVVAFSRQWLDAYYRRDGRMMGLVTTAEGARVIDERLPNARLPDNLPGVVRTLTEPRTTRRGDVATLRTTMTETANDAAMQLKVVSEVAQTWRQSGGRWMLTEVLIGSASR